MSGFEKKPDWNFEWDWVSDSETTELSGESPEPNSEINSLDESLYERNLNDNPSPSLFDSPSSKRARHSSESDVELIDTGGSAEFNEIIESDSEIYGNLSDIDDNDGEGQNSDSENTDNSNYSTSSSESESDSEYDDTNTGPQLIAISASHRLYPQFHILDGEATYVMQTTRISNKKIYLKCSSASKEVGIFK